MQLTRIKSSSHNAGGGLPLSNTNADDAVIDAFNAAFTASIKSPRDISTVQISQVHLLCQDWTQYFEAEGLQLQHYGMLVPNSDRAGENSVLPGINGATAGHCLPEQICPLRVSTVADRILLGTCPKDTISFNDLKSTLVFLLNTYFTGRGQEPSIPVDIMTLTLEPSVKPTTPGAPSTLPTITKWPIAARQVMRDQALGIHASFQTVCKPFESGVLISKESQASATRSGLTAERMGLKTAREKNLAKDHEIMQPAIQQQQVVVRISYAARPCMHQVTAHTTP
ncbi:uncharacterized protein BO96DRAFT_433812 [Aspergillus niger CBS 101883]|uniref:Contig An11c0190, genomic contig n=2 Tax=Aspergillus niger TaxID=5061 RepID=A2QWF5_ASPNC|nr:uncharacterized protein BO96DRAFT_433812 [Aspergillus niger CBS 101883]XP_059601600.1 uncharacterized protein An11g04960 [Aspergillus niger]PYH57019.1 hypothetical protein BO96DRAFT_433812 [Aspergillus niger CBS 101883]CAK40701.1 unnamed protein product [Aspergillus niger]